MHIGLGLDNLLGMCQDIPIAAIDLILLIFHVYLYEVFLAASLSGGLVRIVCPLIVNLCFSIIRNIHQFQLLLEELALLFVILVFFDLNEFHALKAESVKFPLLDILDQLLLHFFLIEVAGIFSNVIKV